MPYSETTLTRAQASRTRRVIGAASQSIASASRARSITLVTVGSVTPSPVASELLGIGPRLRSRNSTLIWAMVSSPSVASSRSPALWKRLTRRTSSIARSRVSDATASGPDARLQPRFRPDLRVDADGRPFAAEHPDDLLDGLTTVVVHGL